MNDTLEIVTFGGLVLRRNGITLPGLTYRKAEALLIYLASTRRPHSREILATMFWDDLGQERALNNLRVLLTHLRPQFAPFLTITRPTIAFNPELAYRFDVEEFEQGLRSLRQPGTPNLEQVRHAVALYRGDFLAGFAVRDSPAFETWAAEERDRLQQQYLAALEMLIIGNLAQGLYAESAAWSDRVLQIDPFRERVHRRRMRALAFAGQTGAALAQYERYRQLLATELGSMPAPETTALWEQIRSGQLKPVAPPSVPSALTPGAPQRAVPTAVDERQPYTTTFNGFEVPDMGSFHGRHDELATLERWVCEEGSRVVTVAGLGGIGKTALAARLAAVVTDQFERVLWRSLLNAPPAGDVLRDWLQILSGQQLQTLPPGIDERIGLLVDYLVQQRCLLVLDNVESILLAGDHAGTYREEYTGYGQLIDRIAQSPHGSCLVLTTREQPLHLAHLERPVAAVRTLQLHGLGADAGLEILQEVGLTGIGGQDALIERYSGNPLALRLVAATIQDLFAGDAAAFLQDESPIFDDIRDVLDQQFGRLTPLEQDLLGWLAVEREPVSIATLVDNLKGRETQRAVLEAVRSLKRRSLLEQQGSEFTLQNVVMEYITDRLITAALDELERGQLTQLGRHALLKAQAKEYVRQSQVRLLLEPIGNRLRARYGTAGTLALLARMLAGIRETPALATSYAAGNVLNLLLHLGYDVSGYDFSGLAVWQVDLRGRSLPGVTFAGGDLSGSVFTEDFRTIGSLAWSPDGEIVAGGASDGTIRLWQAADGQLAGVYSGHIGDVPAVAFSPDGRLLASSSDDKSVRLWDTATGEAAHLQRAHRLKVLAVAFNPDGTLLASGGSDSVVHIWDTTTGRLLRSLEGHERNVATVAFSPDGRLLASGSWDHSLRLWDVTSGDLVQELSGHDSAVSGVAWSPDGTILVTSSWDHTLRLWHVATGACLRTLSGHTVGVVAVAFNPDGTTMASASDDRTVRIWDATTGDPLYTLHGHDHTVVSVVFSPDGSTLASSSADLTVRFWNAHTGQALRTLRGETSWIQSLLFTSQDTVLVSGNGGYKVRVWTGSLAPGPSTVPTVGSGRMLHVLAGHTSWFGTTAWGPDGRLLASASWDQTVRLWDAQSGQALHILHGHERPIVAVAVSHDTRLVASASWDLTARLWDARTGQALHTMGGHRYRVLAVAISPDTQVLASGGWDQEIRLWSTSTGQLIGELVGHTSLVRALAFSPDGRILASGGDDRSIRLWDYATGVAVRTLQAHTDDILCLAWSADGCLLASGSWDQTVRLWDAHTGQQIWLLAGHSASIRVLAFSRDGALLASGSDDDTVRFWDLETGRCLHILHAPQPYAGMNITGVAGLTAAQRSALRTLGAVETSDEAAPHEWGRSSP